MVVAFFPSSGVPGNTSQDTDFPYEAEMPLHQIRMDGETQIRFKLDLAHVEDLLEALRSGAELPPPDVFFDGKYYWAADGFHRFEAYLKIGDKSVRVRVHKGDRQDAIRHSIKVNSKHTALKLTRQEKRKNVAWYLQDPESASLSNNKIAELCGVSPTTVGNIKNQLVQSGESIAAAETKQVSRNGSTYTMNVANISDRKEKEAHPFEEVRALYAPYGEFTRTSNQSRKYELSRPGKSLFFRGLTEAFNAFPSIAKEYPTLEELAESNRGNKSCLNCTHCDAHREGLETGEIFCGIKQTTVDNDRTKEMAAGCNTWRQKSLGVVAFGNASMPTGIIPVITQEMQQEILENPPEATFVSVLLTSEQIQKLERLGEPEKLSWDEYLRKVVDAL